MIEKSVSTCGYTSGQTAKGAYPRIVADFRFWEGKGWDSDGQNGYIACVRLKIDGKTRRTVRDVHLLRGSRLRGLSGAEVRTLSSMEFAVWPPLPQAWHQASVDMALTVCKAQYDYEQRASR